ncbi:Hypothetical predicted protein [Xyrichtys novacula]|uniref:Uncharacterized protein n=1 Tax=Xyrichtys novacula TaxID=13765 RepID=A0AAV1FFQ2_XYRNO|nr:Hypothetical predicted protein [Xyrichtys novacula]
METTNLSDLIKRRRRRSVSSSSVLLRSSPSTGQTDGKEVDVIGRPPAVRTRCRSEEEDPGPRGTHVTWSYYTLLRL